MATINIPMTGDWVAVAGAGNATVSSTYGAAQWATGATQPALSNGHVLPLNQAVSFGLEAGDVLWVKGEAGYGLLVDRDAAP